MRKVWRFSPALNPCPHRRLMSLDMGALIAGDVASNLPHDVRERGTTLPDLARYTSWGGMLFVFSL